MGRHIALGESIVMHQKDFAYAKGELSGLRSSLYHGEWSERFYF